MEMMTLRRFRHMQQAAFQGTNQMADAFGMPSATGQYMPQAQTFDGGIRGYSSAPTFDQAVVSLLKASWSSQLSWQF